MQEEEEKHKLSSDTILYFLHQSTSQSDQSNKIWEWINNYDTIYLFTSNIISFSIIYFPFYYSSDGRYILSALKFKSLRSPPKDFSHTLEWPSSKIKIKSNKSARGRTEAQISTYLLPFYFVFHHLSSILLFIRWKIHIKCSRIWVNKAPQKYSSHPLEWPPSKIKIKSNKSARGRREAQIIIRHNIVLLTPKYLTVWSKFKIWEWINKYYIIYLFTSISFCFPSFIFHFIIHKMEGTF